MNHPRSLCFPDIGGLYIFSGETLFVGLLLLRLWYQTQRASKSKAVCERKFLILVAVSAAVRLCVKRKWILFLFAQSFARIDSHDQVTSHVGAVLFALLLDWLKRCAGWKRVYMFFCTFLWREIEFGCYVHETETGYDAAGDWIWPQHSSVIALR